MPISSRSLRATAQRQVKLVDHDDGRGPVPEVPVLTVVGVRSQDEVTRLYAQATLHLHTSKDKDIRAFSQGVLDTLDWLTDPGKARPWLVDLTGKSD